MFIFFCQAHVGKDGVPTSVNVLLGQVVKTAAKVSIKKDGEQKNMQHSVFQNFSIWYWSRTCLNAGPCIRVYDNCVKFFYDFVSRNWTALYIPWRWLYDVQASQWSSAVCLVQWDRIPHTSTQWPPYVCRSSQQQEDPTRGTGILSR